MKIAVLAIGALLALPFALRAAENVVTCKTNEMTNVRTCTSETASFTGTGFYFAHFEKGELDLVVLRDGQLKPMRPDALFVKLDGAPAIRIEGREAMRPDVQCLGSSCLWKSVVSVTPTSVQWDAMAKAQTIRVALGQGDYAGEPMDMSPGLVRDWLAGFAANGITPKP